jgi:hypothetical protein
MIYIYKDVELEDEFIVLDENDNPVTGLIQDNFTTLLYNPDEEEVSNISAGIPVTISEVGDGIYKATFTPDTFGNWEFIIYHATYFPWGKVGHYKVKEQINPETKAYLERIIGLSLENYRIIDPIHDDKANKLLSGKIKIYPSATDVDNDTNATAEYEIQTTYGIGKFRNNVTGFKVKKIG